MKVWRLMLAAVAAWVALLIVNTVMVMSLTSTGSVFRSWPQAITGLLVSDACYAVLTTIGFAWMSQPGRNGWLKGLAFGGLMFSLIHLPDRSYQLLGGGSPFTGAQGEWLGFNLLRCLAAGLALGLLQPMLIRGHAPGIGVSRPWRLSRVILAALAAGVVLLVLYYMDNAIQVSLLHRRIVALRSPFEDVPMLVSVFMTAGLLSLAFGWIIRAGQRPGVAPGVLFGVLMFAVVYATALVNSLVIDARWMNMGELETTAVQLLRYVVVGTTLGLVHKA